MDEATLRKDLSGLFRSDVASHEDVMQECLKICRLFHIPAQDLFISWEAFDLSNTEQGQSSSKNKNTGRSQLTVQLAQDLKGYIQRKREQERERTTASAHKVAPRRSMPKGGLLNTGLGPTGTPQRAALQPAPVARPRVDFRQQESGENRNYRYMYGKLSQKAEILDDLIDEFGELVRQHYDLEELGDPAAVTEEEVVIVGRICSDSETKLTESSILLESSRMSGSGMRTPLKFEPGFSIRGRGENAIGLFPGQIVALKGKNGGGGWFAATEALEIPRLEPAPSPPSTSSSSAFSAIIACGPFTPDTDLLYKPLEILLGEVVKIKPGVLFLIGPFIDSNHPMIKKGDIDHTPLEIFQNRIALRLRQCLQACPGMSLAIVPGVRDLVSFHDSFPQAALSPEVEVLLPKMAHLLPNPCSVLMNSVSLAASSVDVLFHLRKEEYVKRVESGSSIQLDPMASLAAHVISQRSLYPIFPPSKDVSADVNLDVLHYDALRIGPIAPAILVLPSLLKQFHKVVNETLVLNPSYLSRGNYAYLECPDASVIGSGGDSRPWDTFWKRATVDLRRLPAQ